MSIQGFNRADLSSLMQQLGATGRGGNTRSGNHLSAADRLAQTEKQTLEQLPSDSPNKTERKASYSEILKAQQQDASPISEKIKDVLPSFSSRPSSTPQSPAYLDQAYNPYEGELGDLTAFQKRNMKNSAKAAEFRELAKTTPETMPTTKSIVRLALEFDTDFNNSISLDELEHFKNKPDREIVGDDNAKKIENQLQLADKFIKHYDKIANLDGGDGISQQDLNKLSSLSTTHQGLITEMDYMMLYDKYQNLFT